MTVNDVKKMTIWGNHSNTQYPDLFHCEVNGKSAYEAVGDHDWVDETYIPTVATRGGAIIKARGASSAASAANAAVDHIRSWSLGTPEGDWVSMGGAVRRQLRRARGHHLELPVRLQRTARTRSSRGSTSTTTAARKIDASAGRARQPSATRSATSA